VQIKNISTKGGLTLAKQFLKIFTIWSIGALTYGTIEIISRGYTHISMGILGGICLISIDTLNRRFGSKLSIPFKMLISSAIITILEFGTGLIVNVWLNLNVWDYSEAPLNVCGQICLPFCFVWFFLSFLGIVLEIFIRKKIFCEDLPHYILLNKTV